MGNLCGWMLGLGILVGVGTQQLKAEDKAVPPPAKAEDKAAAPLPDVIVFTNGDQLSGALVRGVGDSVVFKSDMAGELTIPLSKVRELRSSGSFAVLKKNAPVSRGDLHPGTLEVTDGTVVVASPMGAPEQMPIKDVAYILDQTTFDREVEKKAGPLYGWTGAVNAGATFVQSTQHGGTFNAGLTLARTVPTVTFLNPRNRTLLDVSETYGKLTTPTIPQTEPTPTPDSVVKTSVFHADLERDQYFTQRFYALANTSFDHNFSQGLQLQSVYGLGIGWTPISTPKQQLDVKADLHYEGQGFQDPSTNLDLIGSTLAETYKRTLPRKLVLTEQASVLPAWNNFNAYSANGSIGLSLPLFKRLSVALTTTDNFINNPSTGYKKNSFQFVTGITYSLK
ncbi:DUF481 domain-containing protein [Terriglobus saanensis]|uniref:DUF481 domain-containing protein n=1 Tax=Terriglobus saanensis (strain ATCC BAA-1853 / DSM 23119 / SP1PR4) TaxID=401053 RepID=E8UZ87_TERSS|nr:DUF481 domain-containing protein [Terriglobus saanensis]ADV82105.1 hypothetical protein AciPR4_1281 [Terriglobus saanensis SP1PR4]